MDTLNKSIELINLYDSYQDLLTDKQKTYFEDYYFEDFSLAEIALENSVSRNAVFDLLKRTVKKLYEYEVKLKLVKKASMRSEIITSMKSENNLKELNKLIKELEKVE